MSVLARGNLIGFGIINEAFLLSSQAKTGKPMPKPDRTLARYFEQLFKTYLTQTPPTLGEAAASAAEKALTPLRASIEAKKGIPKYSEGDWEKILTLLQLDTALEGTFLYLVQREIYTEDPESAVLPYLATLCRLRTGMEIYYSTRIGAGLNIQHGTGIVIGPRCTIGKNFIVHQGVTLGQRHLHSPLETIHIGDNVTVFAGATILGPSTIGDNVQIGANAVLIGDAEANSVYVGSPARKVSTLKKVAA